MDSLFYLVSGVIALALFALIARNLWLLDRREREWQREAAKAAEPPPPPQERGASDFLEPPVPPPTGEEESPTRVAPPGLLEEYRRQPAAPPPTPARGTPAVTEAGAQEPVRFSAYYPKEVAPQVWHPLAAYIFRGGAAEQVAADARQQLGDRIIGYREVEEAAVQPLREGAPVKAEPQLEGFQFNPPSVTIGFFEAWHRFDFKLRANDAPLDQAVNGQITFTVEGLIVGEIPLSVYVGESVAESAVASAEQKAYSAVFASYSRKDINIVQRVERAYRALGMDVLRDLISIRSGEDWNDALKTLIDRADIFQLFWSSNSAPSEHVRREWEYALELAQTRHKFIRPVYWEQPLPPVPDTLSHIHFAYHPDLNEEQG